MSTRQSVSNNEMDSEEDREYEKCGVEIGCGKCRSKSFCNNAKGALLFLSFAAFLQGFVINGLINVVISTIERRFQLRSSETGLVASMYDVATCICIPLVTYVGGHGNKPLWIGWGIMIMGIGTIVFSMPHYFAPTYSITIGELDCIGNGTENCTEGIRAYRGFFIMSQILHGVGAAPLYTLAITYLDENVTKNNSAMYQGVFYGFSLLGPGLGFLIGGAFLRLFTNLNENPGVNDDSFAWVGAWWLGFIIAGIVTMFVSLPVLLYPQQLPGTDKVRVDREKEMHQSKAAAKVQGDENFGKSLRDIPRCLLITIKNPTLMFISIAGAMDGGLLSGLATFGPKYIEAMFSVSASDAAFYFGVLAILCASLGQVIGGLVVSKFKMTVTTMLRMITVTAIMSFVVLFMFLYKCENIEIAGVTLPYHGESGLSCSIESPCGCSVSIYQPICGKDNLTYLSYCDAQCELVNSTAITNCQRIADSGVIALDAATATTKKCSTEDCPLLYLFMVVIGVGIFLLFFAGLPSLQISLRCVPFAHRSFSIGIQWIILRMLGSIPLPLIYGRVLDLSCTVWGEECGECGACKVYDNNKMSTYLSTLTLIVKGISIIFIILAWRTYNPPVDENDVVPTNDIVPANPKNDKVDEHQEYDNPTFAE